MSASEIVPDTVTTVSADAPATQPDPSDVWAQTDVILADLNRLALRGARRGRSSSHPTSSIYIAAPARPESVEEQPREEPATRAEVARSNAGEFKLATIGSDVSGEAVYRSMAEPRSLTQRNESTLSESSPRKASKVFSMGGAKSPLKGLYSLSKGNLFGARQSTDQLSRDGDPAGRTGKEKKKSLLPSIRTKPVAATSEAIVWNVSPLAEDSLSGATSDLDVENREYQSEHRPTEAASAHILSASRGRMGLGEVGRSTTELNIGDEMKESIKKAIQTEARQSHFIRIYMEEDNLASSTFFCHRDITGKELRALAATKFGVKNPPAFVLLVELRLSGIRRVLGDTELPAHIQIGLLEVLGFDKSMYLQKLERFDLSFLVKFIYRDLSATKSEPLSPDSKIGEKVDLCKKGLFRIPRSVEKAASRIRKLYISENPGITDLDQSLVKHLTELQMLRMAKCSLAQLPASILQVKWILMLDLSFNRIKTLTGSGLEALSELQELDLSYNQLEEFPPDILSSLRKLKKLYISGNRFSSLPNFAVGELSATLNTLDLSHCHIPGIIPSSLGSLVSLQTLRLSFNRLVGAIPWTVGGLNKLVEIDVRGNALGEDGEGEEAATLTVLANCRSLERIRADGNRIRWVGRMNDRGSERRIKPEAEQMSDTGSEAEPLVSPPAVVAPTSLKKTGEPAALDFPKLRSVGLMNQTCSSTVPRPMEFSLSNIAATMTALHLSNAGIEKLPHRFFQRLKGLEELDLRCNKLTKLPPFTVAGHPYGEGCFYLRHLNVAGNSLTELPLEIRNLTHLETLQVQHNTLTTLPAGLWSCAGLKHLNASRNTLTCFPDPDHDDGVEEAHAAPPPPSQHSSPIRRPKASLAARVKRQEFCVSVASTTSMSQDSEYQSTMQMSTPLGSIPPAEESVLTPLSHSLISLVLGNNQLTEDMALPLFYLPNLQYLNLSNNAIKDMTVLIVGNPVPDVLKPWFTHLRWMNLGGNSIPSIPREIDELRSLQVLYMNGNRLASVPGEVAKLTRLRVFDLGGQVGAQGVGTGLRYNIANWPYDWNWNWNVGLQYLNLSGNKRLEIKPPSGGGHQTTPLGHGIAEFSNLPALRNLGLMDVTCTINTPDETKDRRVRTTASDVPMPCAKKGSFRYTFSDSPCTEVSGDDSNATFSGSSDLATSLDVWDLARPNFRGRDNEAVFALFDGRGTAAGQRVARFLFDEFEGIFAGELDREETKVFEQIDSTGAAGEDSAAEAAMVEARKLALRRAVLLANNQIAQAYDGFSGEERGAVDASSELYGCSATIAHLVSSATDEEPRACSLVVANVGDGVAVLSRSRGQVEVLTQNHVYYMEALAHSDEILNDHRRRLQKKDSDADGRDSWVYEEWSRLQSSGIEVPLGPPQQTELRLPTRGFGYRPLLGAVTANPQIRHIQLNSGAGSQAGPATGAKVSRGDDEFLVLASAALWNAMRIGGSYVDGAKQIVDTVREVMLGTPSKDGGSGEPGIKRASSVGRGSPAAAAKANTQNTFERWGLAAMYLRDTALSIGDETQPLELPAGRKRGLATMVIGMSAVRKKRAQLDKKVPAESEAEPRSDKSPQSSELALTVAQSSTIPPSPTAPTGSLALVFTDIQSSTAIWEAAPQSMQESVKLHHSLMRKLLRETGGYEVKTEGDAFMVAFQDTLAAVEWCFRAQMELRKIEWPEGIMEVPSCMEVWWRMGESGLVGGAMGTFGAKVAQPGGMNAHVEEAAMVFKGLSIRMGIHVGTPLCEVDPTTGRMDYYGPMVNRSARVASQPHGGQVFISQAVMRELQCRLRYSPQQSIRSRLAASGMNLSSGSATSPMGNHAPRVGSPLRGDASRRSPVGSMLGDNLALVRVRSLARGSRGSSGYELEITDGEDMLDSADTAGELAGEKLRAFGLHAWLVGEVKLKGLETPEIIYAIYPRELKHRHLFYTRIQNGQIVPDEFYQNLANAQRNAGEHLALANGKRILERPPTAGTAQQQPPIVL
ncbi:hypothetical protein DFJ73DRAFT_817619 [Zopfochytrium polystomum]|nr:hypothetical protein DFJ73DRAFT_817619 [Zopfochytrium polystomum]